MSTNYMFYVGYRSKDDVFHAVGPYDCNGELRPLLNKTGGFISQLYTEFHKVDTTLLDKELYDIFVEFYDGKLYCRLQYLPAKDLPSTDYIKRGYYLVDEILECIKDDYYDPYFSERYSETEYGLRLTNAVKNNDTEEIERLKKFMFFSYPDYNSIEHESSIIHNFIAWNGPFSEYDVKEIAKKKVEETGDENEDFKELVILLDIE